MPGLLDVVLLYDCNLACDYCTITPQMRTRALETQDVLGEMRRGRQDEFDRIAFTGGEPMLRRDLLGLVKAARQLGYGSIKVQSNGMMFAAPANVERLVEAGVNLFHISIHRRKADDYDRIVHRPDSHALMLAGLQNVIATGQEVVVDVIVERDTYRDLPATVEWIRDLGAKAIDLWFVSLTDNNAANLETLPRMTEAIPPMTEAFAIGDAAGMRIRSLHLPRCLLREHLEHVFDPGSQRVRVLTPDAVFDLADSRLAGHEFVAACEGCEFQDVCPGLRPDYLDVYGDEEIANARGRSSSRGPIRKLPVTR